MTQGVSNPSITVCIANFNGEYIIGPCLESVLEQNISEDIEIIVHDDASTDNSVALIEQNYPQARLIKSSKNIGFCKSNNKMAEIAQGQYILFLNNDTVLFKDALFTLYTSATTADQPIIFGLPQYNMESGNLIDRGSFFDPFLNAVPNFSERKHNVGMIIGACLWIPKNLWDELEGFPDWFDTLAEDLYLCLFAHVKGYEVRIIHSSGFQHWIGKSLGGGKVDKASLSTTYRRRHMTERNKCYCMVLFFPIPLLAITLPIHLFLLIIEGILLSLLTRDKNTWLIIYAGLFKAIWKKKFYLLNKRKRIQHQRLITYKDFLSLFVWYPYKLKMLLRYGLPRLK